MRAAATHRLPTRPPLAPAPTPARVPAWPSPAGRGFTLLEVMVALAILAMSLVAAFDVVGGALRNHERTRALELATLLARGKLVELEAKFQEDGFRDFDQTEEGTFEEEGHAEVAWTATAVKPTVELGAEGVVKALTGASGGLEGLLGLAGGKAGEGGASGQGPLPDGAPAAAALAAIQGQLSALGEEIKKGVRQLRLTVSWKEGAREERFTVVTHLVVLTPGSQAPALPPVGALPPAGLPPASLPGFQPPPAFDPGAAMRPGRLRGRDRLNPGGNQ